MKEIEDNIMMLADIFPPYYSTELANVSVGKAVAVFGAGLLAYLQLTVDLIEGMT